MPRTNQLPDFGRLSSISAVIILAYGLVPFVQIPAQSIVIRFPWAVFNFDLDFGSIVSILVAFLAAFGADWSLTAWLIGVPLSFLEVGIEWWIVVALGGILLAFILVAEFLVVDPDSESHLPASLGLTAISFALFLVLAIALQASEMRLFLLLPALSVTVFFLVSRSLYLQTSGDWNWFWSFGVAYFVAQVALGLHYLPIQPLSFGLVLVGFAYPLTLLIIAYKQGKRGLNLLIEPLILFIFLFLLALITNG